MSWENRERFRLGRMRGPEALPLIMGAGSAVAGAIGGKQANAAQTAATSRFDTATGKTNAEANSLNSAGGTLTNTLGTPAVGQAEGYYSTLLGKGGRSAMQAATAPAAAQIGQAASGAARAITPGDRSGTAALQRANISRDAAGQVGRLTAGVQGQAANALGSLGSTSAGQGLGALQGAGSLYAGGANNAGSLLGQQMNQTAGAKGGIGQGLGGMAALAANKPKGGGGGGGASPNYLTSGTNGVGVGYGANA